MSYQVNSAYLRKQKVLLKKKHLSASEYKKGMNIDIITVGDSYSDGGGGGKNPYYQDYIATMHNKTVLNIERLAPEKSIIKTILALINSGVIDEIKPKILILQTGERAVVKRFSQNINYKYTLKKENIYNQFSNMTLHDVSIYPSNNISFINSGNYKFLLNSIKYEKRICLSNHVCRIKLTKDFFSVQDSNVLEFYQDNITNIPLVNKKNITKVNSAFNKLAELLKEKNISLYIMIAVDKFDLYSPYLKTNPFGKNNTFELLGEMSKNYTFINTKKILRKLIKEEQQDIYFADDTHWSYKASEAIIKNTTF
jgi:hypothetical protein